jgi:flavorubredoxin
MVLYYSRTGNTEKMADTIAEVLKSFPQMEVELKIHAAPEELEKIDALIIGMPTYHHDMSSDMKKLLEEIAFKGINLEGKIGATFGSYGWSGEAPNLILEIMEKKLGMKTIKPPLLVMYTPNEKSLEECRKFGRRIAEELSSTI